MIFKICYSSNLHLAFAMSKKHFGHGTSMEAVLYLTADVSGEVKSQEGLHFVVLKCEPLRNIV